MVRVGEHLTKWHKEAFVGKVYVLFPSYTVSQMYTYVKNYQVVHMRLCSLLCVARPQRDYKIRK